MKQDLFLWITVFWSFSYHLIFNIILKSDISGIIKNQWFGMNFVTETFDTPRSLDPFYLNKLLYKMGQDFLDIQKS